eukprot:2584586-Ditylum_brightwellii.AAC.1
MKKEIEEGHIFGRMVLTVGRWEGCGCIDLIGREMKEEDRAAKLAAPEVASKHLEIENINHNDLNNEKKDGIDVNPIEFNGYNGGNGVPASMSKDGTHNAVNIVASNVSSISHQYGDSDCYGSVWHWTGLQLSNT